MATSHPRPERGLGPGARAYDALIRTAALGVRAMSRLVRVGAGTSAPGLVVQRLDPGFVDRRARLLSDGIVVVSGTNGKTTTAAMIADILRARGRSVLTNESGANLFRGVATAFATANGDERAGVFEVDEGALERLTRVLQPRVLVLTNVFRDQLDRFGEPETVAGLLAGAARDLPPGSTVVANADDPLLWHAVEDLRPVAFGVRLPEGPSAASRSDGEPEVCPVCGATLRHRGRILAHLGPAACDACGWSNPEPSVLADVVDQPRLDALRLAIGGVPCDLRLGGVHNAYNAAAAVAAAEAMGVSRIHSVSALGAFTPRFGRTESLEFEGRTLWVLLMKNPAGASALVQQVAHDPRIRAAAVLLNDRWADGRDVSWIWDADLESLVGLGMPIVAGGIRADDIGVRIKYAGGRIAASANHLPDLLREIVAVTEPGDDVAVLATYTAMLAFRSEVLGSRRARVADLEVTTGR